MITKTPPLSLSLYSIPFPSPSSKGDIVRDQREEFARVLSQRGRGEKSNKRVVGPSIRSFSLSRSAISRSTERYNETKIKGAGYILWRYANNRAVSRKGKKEREEKEKKIRTRVLECEQLVLQGTTEQQAGYNNRKKTTRVNYTLSPWTRQLGYKRERRLSFMRIRTKLRQQRDEKITVR